MGNYDINIEWSRLFPLTEEETKKFNQGKIEGVYRISRKESDGKFYVIFVGNTMDLKQDLEKLILEKDTNFLKQGGEFSFRYAKVTEGEETRRAIEKQMYKKYAPEYNSKEPISSLDIKVNLN